MSNNNLLPLPLKPTDPLPTLAQDLLSFLDAHSEHTHPHELRADAQAWQDERLRLFGTSDGGLPLVGSATPDDLVNYFNQLSFVSTKLPSSLSITFSWYPLFTNPSSSVPTGAFAPASRAVAARNLDYERISVLYDVAAVYAHLGAERRRSDEDGMKAAMHFFQLAAGTLNHALNLLPAVLASLKTAAAPVSPDLTTPLLECLRDMCLAQAQEVAWQKAVRSRLKNNTVAKLALKASELYGAAAGQADAAIVPGVFGVPTDLIRYLQIKSAHFAGVAQYRRSLDDSDARRYGDQLGRLQLAEQRLREAVALGKRGVPEAVVSDLKSLQAVVTKDLTQATKDNELIYLATPTPPSSLPPTVSAALAQPITPPALDAAPKRPWLRQLVPKEVGEVLALWEDRKREWLDGVFEAEVKELESAATSTLNALHLPAMLEATVQPLGVPASLLNQAATVKAEGGVERLEAMMKDVRRVAEVNRRMLQETNDLLDQEAKTDAAHRQAHGTNRWTRLPSEQAAAALRERAQQMSGLLASAAESDTLVRRKYAEWEEPLRLLGEGQVALSAAIPAVQPSSSSTQQEQALARQLRSHLEELSELRAARLRLLEAARTRLLQADLRERVLREAERRPSAAGDGFDNAAEFEGLLVRELGQVAQPLEEELARSRGMQEDLLAKIKTAHSAFVAARAVPPDAVQRREAVLQGLDTAASKYGEIRSNTTEALKFYTELSKLLGELRESAKSFTFSRSTEAEAHAKALSAPPPVPPAQVDPPATSLVSDLAPPPLRRTRTPRSTPAGGAQATRSTLAGAAPAFSPRRTKEDVKEDSVPDGGAWDPTRGIRFG
ncbi:hypothetical protein JCM8097_008246 [Rhodosporidiobolus ruineniae]